MSLAVLSSSKRMAPAPTSLAKAKSRRSMRVNGSAAGLVGSVPRLGATGSPPPLGLQTKLKVGAPNDKFEQEADRIADHVLRMPAPRAWEKPAIFNSASPSRIPHMRRDCEGGLDPRPVAVQRMCSECEQEVLRQPVEDREEGTIAAQEAAARSPEVTADVQSQINGLRGRGQPLPASVRAFFEPRFDHDFSQVRFHTVTQAARAAKAINSKAFTFGHDIMFGSGQYAPHTSVGMHLLAHELTHVIQQKSANPPSRPIQRRVNGANVDCHPPAAADIPVVGANPLTTLRAADSQSIELLTNARDDLEHGRNRILAGEPAAWPVISDHTATGLRRIFRMDPEDPAIWTGTGARSVHVLIRRLEIARGLLQSGTIQYHCRSATVGACGFGCGLTPCCTGDSFGGTCFGIFRNFLCDPYWGQGATGRTYTVLHEPFHMSFDFIGDTGRWANAHCYSRLAFWLNGRDVPAGRRGQCPLA